MHYTLILTLAAGLSCALVLGYATQRAGLSPILGYLLAGIAVGPRTPGFVADPALAAELAEVGVILLMFGVGLHFHVKDLVAVRSVAVPGAIGQTVVATAQGAALALALGWGLGGGLVLGIALGVASTVVLLRVLLDNRVLDTPAGHIAVGWLIVEDVLTVLALVLLPALAGPGASGGAWAAAGSLGLALVKVAVLTALLLGLGTRVIPRLLLLVARSRSHELFTLAVLAIALAIAVLSAVVFGASMALGAFLAGLVVGQSELSHQAAADALPMRDAFAVLFFVSVGMLFDPGLLVAEPLLVLAALAIILVAKPLAALVLVALCGASARSGLVVALGLAQIGEFSFILAELAGQLGVLPASGRSVLVAGALISIGLNPLLFRALPRIERALQASPRLWSLLNRRAEARGRAASEVAARALASEARSAGSAVEERAARTAAAAAATTGSSPAAAATGDAAPAAGAKIAPPARAVVVGWGPTGETAGELLADLGIETVVVDLNVDTIARLAARQRLAIYGDASRREVLRAAGIERARYLLVTLPAVGARVPVVKAARALNPDLRVFVRARYLGERAELEGLGVTAVCYEEAEVAVGLAERILGEVGADPARVESEVARLRERVRLRAGGPPAARG